MRRHPSPSRTSSGTHVDAEVEGATHMTSGIPREVGFLVHPPFTLLDLSGPLEAFKWAEQMRPGSYRLSVTSLDGGEVIATSRLPIITRPVSGDRLDTLIVVGGCPETIPRALLDHVRLASAGTRRVASVSTGTFILAGAGLLDGRAATTHWQFAAKLQAMYPAIQVDADRVFVDASGV